MFDVVGLGALNVDYVATRSALSATDPYLVAELRQRFEHNTERPATLEEVNEVIQEARSIPFEACLGGSAFNVIQALAHMNNGFRLGFIGVAGAPREHPSVDLDFSSWFTRYRVDARMVQRSSIPPGTCISYIDDGVRSLLTHPGANVGIAELIRDKHDEIVDYLSLARIVHVTSLFDDTSPPLIARVLQAAKRRNPWLAVSFDPGHHWSLTKPPGFAEILGVADYVFLNAREFHNLGAYHVGDRDEDLAKRIFRSCGERALAVILKRYDCITVFARMDRRLVERQFGNVALEPDQIEDATGTGDIFAAGFLASRILPWLELCHGVTLGLRLVHQKLRVGGSRNVALFGSIFDRVIEEIIAEHGAAPMRPSQPSPSPSSAPMVASEAATTYCHSPDFRSFRMGDVEYSLSRMQARVVEELLKAWQGRVPDVGQAVLLRRVSSDAKRLHDLFRMSDAWQSLVIPGRGKGTWRLALPRGARFQQPAGEG